MRLMQHSAACRRRRTDGRMPRRPDVPIPTAAACRSHMNIYCPAMGGCVCEGAELEQMRGRVLACIGFYHMGMNVVKI
jgi:hypothetical protein